MLEMTPAVQRAVASAQLWMQELGGEEITPLHLLLGVFEEEEGLVAEQFQNQQIAIRDLRLQLGAQEEPLTAGVELETKEFTDFPPLVQSLLFQAKSQALNMADESTISSVYLLIAILQSDQQLHGELQELGFDLSQLQSALQKDEVITLEVEEALQLTEATEFMDIGRILDANANRAGEALRVIEEYCRFVLEDTFLSKQWKECRHELQQCMQQLNPQQLLQARDTCGDVGTTIHTKTEGHRVSALHVVQANLKRLQESLRSLEEYGKILNSAWANDIEELRYRSYTLEQAVLLGTHTRQKFRDLCLYALVSKSLCVAELKWTIQEMVAGGVQIIQLREKQLSDRDLIALAKNCCEWTRRAGALFILNDRPDVARLIEADGVHLGQEDMQIQDARRILGVDKIIGISTHNLEQYRQAILGGADYVGVGPTFPSTTKQFEQLAGLEFVQQAAAESSIPAFAIGGIGLHNLQQVIDAGIRRVAVSSSLCQVDDPQKVARQFREMLKS